MARVLLVDDDPAVRRSLSRILKSLGHDVAAVDCGPAALEHVARESVDLLVVDMRMPGWDGVTTCQQIRRHVSQPPPAVLLTAAADGANLALANGMNFLAKPCGADELRKELELTLAGGAMAPVERCAGSAAS